MPPIPENFISTALDAGFYWRWSHWRSGKWHYERLSEPFGGWSFQTEKDTEPPAGIGLHVYRTHGLNSRHSNVLL